MLTTIPKMNEFRILSLRIVSDFRRVKTRTGGEAVVEYGDKFKGEKRYTILSKYTNLLDKQHVYV